MSEMALPIDAHDIAGAMARIAPSLPATPLRSYAALDREVGHGLRVLVKHENHQPTNAFKARNGLSAVTYLMSSDTPPAGVVAATRGNHGQGLAWAASHVGLPVTICVPEGNDPGKNAAMVDLGARLVIEGRDYDESIAVAERLAREDGLQLVHSTNDRHVIAGASTLTAEILQQEPQLDAIVLAVGGGSQAVGALAAVRASGRDIRVFGVQAANASACHDSWHAGEPRETKSADTIADGLATRKSYSMTFPALRDGLAGFVTVTEDEIRAALRSLVVNTHTMVEPAGAAGYAGLRRLAPELTGTVAVVISGGNVDPGLLAEILAAGS